MVIEFSRDKQLMPASMASDGELWRLFEKPLPENPTLLEALSACHRNTHPNPSRPIDPSSLTEIFGELHFQEKQPERAVLPQPAPASWARGSTSPPPPRPRRARLTRSCSLDAILPPKPAASSVATVKRSASFCVKKSSASLLLCTEGLGSESTVDADADMLKDGDAEAAAAVKCTVTTADGSRDVDAGASAAEEEAMKEERQPKAFPPPAPIRSIGRRGKPYVYFRSFREDGRFVLLEVVIPGMMELLQATREGGRLRLQFANAAAAAAAGVWAQGDEVRGEDDDQHHAAKNDAYA